MHTELWFPNVIWSAMTHMIDNVELKRYAYQRQKEEKGRVISNVGGWQSNDIGLGEHPQIDKLVTHLNTEIKECANQVGLPELVIQNLWININPPNTYNELHNHVGGVLSGVYYIDSIPEQGNIQFERTDNADCYMPTDVKNTYFTSIRCTYAAKTGALYIFPSWLKHTVKINKTPNDRLSISFNYGEK